MCMLVIMSLYDFGRGHVDRAGDTSSLRQLRKTICEIRREESTHGK